ncbi:asparagine synthase (glutamine-hydrolyzing) [Clostridium sp. Marseille-P299]|uniref:asparagine synthase (glutamine-hydrolyzing) n=1 Tax=Clostridium sp. Marseille-P299 TaxID=1805477 RepID=UPI00082AF5E4|nr:asparagine synthase (glutamine-hydrolyzing) [Clostridium sp. Marseille-P299]
MCGIAGFYNAKQDYLAKESYHKNILWNMSNCIKHRGPDEQGIHLTKQFGLAHARLSIIDLLSGQQPMLHKVGNYTYGIVYNGEVYNTKELKDDLISKGWEFQTTSDTEVLLLGYIEYGPKFVEQVNGIFAYAIMDEYTNSLYLFRDRAGVKPLFYSIVDGTIVFGSEIKTLFQFPGITPKINKNGLNEIFSIGPAKTYGCGVFNGIDELLPGNTLHFRDGALKTYPYFQLVSKPHEDSYEETLEKTAFLVEDAIKRQMISDVPICTFLSGGIDSSIVSSVCARELKKKNQILDTYSFDFVNNDTYFKSNFFQPSRDLPFVKKMVDYLGSNHKFLECDNVSLADRLYDSVDARDLPAMADIDSSMVHFCKQVKQYNKVALTGECADEIFGGYPWFHKEECFHANTFPWTMDLNARKVLLKDDVLNELHMEEYVLAAYEKSVAETPRLQGESNEEARRREISYLNLKWFMQTLLDRMDRTSMYCGLEARVPFADHRIIEYVWNVPWTMKSKDGVEKSLLRYACKDLLPDEVLWRKKSPYPKTYDPNYESLLRNRFIEIIEDPSSPILTFIDKEKAYRFMNTTSDYGKPWYGQLMAGPQLLAYYLMIDYWLKKFKIELI